MPPLKERLRIIDDDYLAGISNRGIVNRARKDLAGSGINVGLSDAGLEAAFADGAIVKIIDGPGNFQCSCPSRAICKHVIMALIQASMEVSESSGANEEPPAVSGGFDYLLAYNKDSLVKEFGKTSYNDVLFKLMSGGSCEIEEASILGIKIMEASSENPGLCVTRPIQNAHLPHVNSAFVSVRFLPNASTAESICTCKVKNCRHRLEAIMHYIRHKTGKLDFEPFKAGGDASIEIIAPVALFIEDIFSTGLVRLPSEYAEKCAQFAVLCHGAGFAVFERLFEACAREVELHEQKSVRFNKNALARNLTRIYQMCREIQNGGNEKAAALAGKFKRRYMELPKLRILGLGAYPWYAKSGFCGVTAVFYAPELRQCLTFTSSRPVSSEKEALANIERIWRSKSAWNLPLGFGAIAKGELSLTGAKISEDGRLSSSESTVASLVKPRTAIGSDETGAMNDTFIEGIFIDDFTAIKNLFSSDQDGPRMVYGVLKISGIGEGSFNRISQTYAIHLIDKFENRLALTVRFSKINETAILNLEHMARNGMVPEVLTVGISIPDEGFETRVFPIALWMNGEIKNIDEEKLFPDEDEDKTSYGNLRKPRNQGLTRVFAPVFDHIEQTRHLLFRIFESGLASARKVSDDLDGCGKMAEEMGMPGGAKLLGELDAALRALAAGQEGIGGAVLAYCNALSYYNIAVDMLALETMAAKQ